MLLPLTFILTLSSCDEKAPNGSTIAMTKSMINKKWVNPGIVKDIEYITFVTFYNPLTHKINVSAQAFSKDYKEVGSILKLTTGDAWNDTLPPVAVGINNIYFNKLDILNGEGGLKDFSYVNLTPYADGGYLYFDTKVIAKDGKSQTVSILTAYPCPPCLNCIPSCPPRCSPPCPTPFDSTKTKDSIIMQ